MYCGVSSEVCDIFVTFSGQEITPSEQRRWMILQYVVELDETLFCFYLLGICYDFSTNQRKLKKNVAGYENSCVG